MSSNYVRRVEIRAMDKRLNVGLLLWGQYKYFFGFGRFGSSKNCSKTKGEEKITFEKKFISLFFSFLFLLTLEYFFLAFDAFDLVRIVWKQKGKRRLLSEKFISLFFLFFYYWLFVVDPLYSMTSSGLFLSFIKWLMYLWF